MGQQQLLLIILGVIIVGIAIAVGLSLFSAQSIQANKDAIINDINNIAANAYQFRIRPTSMGGGGGAYNTAKGAAEDYKIPSKMSSNDNGEYSISDPQQNTIKIKGNNPNATSGGQWVEALPRSGWKTTKLGLWDRF